MNSYFYYYTPDSDRKYYKNSSKFKEILVDEVESLKPVIEKAIGKKLNVQYWNKSRFGCIFADFTEGKFKKNGAGELDLYNEIKNKFFAVVFSKDSEINYSYHKPSPRGEILVINYPKFRNLVSLGRKKEIVKIFVDRSEQSESELNKALDEYRKSEKLHLLLKFEDIKSFVEKCTPQELNELKKVVPELIKYVNIFQVEPKNLSSVLDSIVQFSKDNKISPENFAKMVDVIMTNISEKYDLNPSSFSKLVDMMGLLSKNYNINTQPELEKLLDFVIIFLEKHEIKNTTNFGKIFDIVTKLTPKYELKEPTDLKKILELCKMSDQVIESNPKYFKDILDKFKALYENPKTLEQEVHTWIAENPWIIDFKYWAYPIKISPKKISEDDFLDLYLEKSHFKTTYLGLIEFKRPDKKSTKGGYRKNKIVITAEVGHALSQLIHYNERLQHNSYTIIENIVVMGKKTPESDSFIPVFNKYLHNIRVETYESLHEKASNVVKAFSTLPNN